jgi:hypothetical protein
LVNHQIKQAHRRLDCPGRRFRHRRPMQTARRGRRKVPPEAGVFATLCRRSPAGAEREPRRQDQCYIDRGSPIKYSFNL